MLAKLEERQHLLRSRDDSQLLGRDRVHAGDLEDPEQIALDLGPGLLEPQLGVDLVDEEPGADLLGLGADGHPERVGERVRGVRGEHESPLP